MPKKEILVPVAIIALAAAFVVVSALVVISRGHPAFVRRKLRLGALLMALTGAAATGGCAMQTSCYMPPPRDPENLFDFDESAENFELSAFHMNLEQDRVLLFTISYRTVEVLSFLLVDADADAEVHRADIEASDGAFDEDTEEFEIEIPADTPDGRYTLMVFGAPAADVSMDMDPLIHPMVIISSGEGA